MMTTDQMIVIDGRDLGITIIEDELIDTYLPTIKPEGLALYTVLARLSKRGKLTPSQSELGTMMGWTRNTVAKWLEVLERAGLLTAERRYEQNIEISKAYTVLAAQKLSSGTVRPAAQKLSTEDVVDSKPHIFKLYETILGRLVNSIYEAEHLKEIEAIYPVEWIEEAFKKAVEQGARQPLPYSVSILQAWKEKGKDTPPPTRPGGDDESSDDYWARQGYEVIR